VSARKAILADLTSDVTEENRPAWLAALKQAYAAAVPDADRGRRVLQRLLGKEGAK
jgi:truncated hemoglobin YjbI